MKKKSKPSKQQSRLLQSTCIILAVTMLSTWTSINGPELYNVWLRNKVGRATVMITNMDGTSGGTGFHVELPKLIDGQRVTLILTNAHVCGLADKDGNLKVKSSLDEIPQFMIRKVIRASDVTDLCVVEPLPEVEGLSLGSEPKIGDKVTVFGHPGLIPLVDRSGYITGKDMPLVSIDIIMNDIERQACSKPKNRIVTVPGFFGVMELCAIQVPSYDTSINGYPGNSGSPVVDSFGRVVSVLYAGNRFNFAVLLDYKSVKQFLIDGK